MALYLRAKGVEWIDRRGRLVSKVDFSTDSVVAQEIVSQDKLVESLKSFKDFSGDLLLGEDVVFVKEVNGEDLEDKAQKVWDEVPIAPEKMAKRLVVSKGRGLVLATNRRLFEGVKDAIESAGGKVKGVYSEKYKIDFEGSDEVQANKKGFKMGWLAWLAVVLVVILGVVGTGVYMMKNRVVVDKSAEVVETSEATVSETPTPTAKVEIDRSKVTIVVINATGVTGLAAKMRDNLLALGYKEIEVATLDDNGGRNSVAYASGVDELVKVELKEEIGKYLDDLNEDEISEYGLYHVAVTIGTEF